MARLSTHVLDVARGTPARGMVIELHHVNANERRLVTTATTNEEGRTDAPLVSEDRIEPGVYELTFHAADYFRRTGVILDDPPFLGRVVVRVGLADATGHYHVPLLVSPYSYSVYRGS
ncbi:MAG TPA: hydroxyisourate hydrolase [Vicinamibacterales bacterium]|jgi:5-hydroxyisourate hydrolase|nr:hydroxyisourate hydrolase [Vicinamibacterales bacterium]